MTTGRAQAALLSAEQPKVAVIGCGKWGKNLVRTFSKLGALAAIADTSAETAKAMAAEFSVEAADWQAIINNPQIAGVVIASPAPYHAALAQEALKAGKHTYVEKPLALTMSDAKGLVDLAQQQDKLLMVGHLMQYHPAFRKLLEIVRSGQLGELRYITSTRHNLGRVRLNENVFWSFAPHDISMILALTGQMPASITATGGNFLDTSRADTAYAHMSFPSNIQATISVSWLHPIKEQKLVVVGSKASAILDDTMPGEKKLQIIKCRAELTANDGLTFNEGSSYIPFPEEEPLSAECSHFLNCITEGKQPTTDGEEGLRVLHVLAEVEKKMNSSVHSPASQTEYYVHPSSFVDEGCDIGKGTKIWHFSHILPRTKIGADCVISQNVMIGPDVTVGDRCKIQNNVSLYKGVTLSDGVFCGPSCVFTNVLTPRAEVERKDEFKTTPVGRGVTIGANATIVCGHKLGDYSMVAAGAVVTKDVPAYALVAGVPAQRIGWVSQSGDRLGDDLTCPRTGQKYKLIDNNTLEPVA